VKIDTHVHTHYSGYTGLAPLTRLMRESYNTPERVYALAKARGMDLVAITDHDTISGALTLAERPDVIVGCEVTAHFRDGVRVHLNVLDITEAQFAEIDRARLAIHELMPYLRAEGIFVSLNHVASRVNGHVTAAHLAWLLPWVDGMEVRNGSRLAVQNSAACALAAAAGSVPCGGSDAHTERGIGRTWVEAPAATCRASFMRELRAGRVQVGGQHGHYFTMASDILRFATNFYRERIGMLLRHPLAWRNHAVCGVAIAACPLVLVPLVLAHGHFRDEERFTESLLLDLVARPPVSGQAVPEAA
jgi:predicted metal-dependent phosphoesterase TrpH